MFENFANFFRNEMNYLTGRNQEFEQLLDAGDIGRAVGKMQCLKARAMSLYAQYDPEQHDINRRPDKAVTNKLGLIVRIEETAKLAIPYQQYINEMALTFLLGKPITWSCKTEGCEDGFKRFTEILDYVHINSRLREAKRLSGAEGESAILFRVYRNEEGHPDIQCRVLAASKGDGIYTRWDIYGNLLSFAWGYTAKGEEDDTSVECYEVFTPDYIYHCVKAKLGWTVDREENLIGKIPVIVFRQKEEWAGVQGLIERTEHKHSRTADSNDYFEDPMLMLKADVIKSMPEKRESGRTVAVKGDIDLDKAGKFLTYDQASESKKQENEWLDDTILKMSFTPDITIDTMRQVAQLSAKALRTVLLLGYIKADRRKDTWDEMMDRMASLLRAIIGNVLEVRLRSQMERMIVEHHWQEPFGDDITDTIKNITEAYGAGIMSVETAVELNPIIKDKEAEKARLAGEAEDRQKRQDDIFGVQADGAGTGV